MKKLKFIVLGGYGIVGKVVVRDLFNSSEDYHIVIAGRDLEKAESYADSFRSKRVQAHHIDVSNMKDLINAIKDADIVVNCLQYTFNMHVMKACLKAKVNYLDLGNIFKEIRHQFALRKEFEKIGKIALLGAGSSPGITNMMAAYGAKHVKEIESVEIIFADRDIKKSKQKFLLPYNFPSLLDEFTTKPGVFHKGKMTYVQPLSGKKEYKLGGCFGKQNCYYTNHDEVFTFPHFFKEKGIKEVAFRMPYSDTMRNALQTLIDLGFTSDNEIDYVGTSIKPLDFTTKVMNQRAPKTGTKILDEEILRIIINEKHTVDVICASRGEKAAGMINTGVGCSIFAQIIASGTIKKSGVFAPEDIIDPEKFFKQLARRGMELRENEQLKTGKLQNAYKCVMKGGMYK